MVKVIGVGFGRTGTMSLKVALEQLGFGPCYHMFDVVQRPARARAWTDAAAGRPVEWDEVFAGYQATVDWPGAAFWRELVERYPEAKVLLTVRDPDRWYRSAEATIWAGARRRSGLGHRIGGVLLPVLAPGFAGFLRMVQAVVLDRHFGGRVPDRDAAVAEFTAHVERVRAEVPADRLLVFEVGQGWEPLCAFLGVPVPAGPFPRLNDTVSFQRHSRQRTLRLLLPGAAALVALAGAVWWLVG